MDFINYKAALNEWTQGNNSNFPNMFNLITKRLSEATYQSTITFKPDITKKVLGKESIGKKITEEDACKQMYFLLNIKDL